MTKSGTRWENYIGGEWGGGRPKNTPGAATRAGGISGGGPADDTSAARP